MARRANVLSHDGGDGVEHCEWIVINRSVMPYLNEMAGNCVALGRVILIGPGACSLRNGKLAASEWLALPQRGGDDAVDAADLGSGRLCFVVSPFPLARYGVPEVKSFHGVGEVAHEVGAPQFAVRKDVEADLFLALKNPEDVTVFDGLEF